MNTKSLKQQHLVGNTYNRLTIVKVYNIVKKKSRRCLCKCACGKRKKLILASVKSGHTKSCGCLVKETAADTLRKIRARQIDAQIETKETPSILGLMKGIIKRIKGNSIATKVTPPIHPT